ncbi:MAG: response regulator transcription factor [Porticoccaceae bacterium]
MPKEVSSIKLTPREREVVFYLGNGFTYKEISESMGIGVGTVKKHISRSIQKLGAKNSAHTVKILCDHGFFSI